MNTLFTNKINVNNLALYKKKYHQKNINQETYEITYYVELEYHTEYYNLKKMNYLFDKNILYFNKLILNYNNPQIFKYQYDKKYFYNILFYILIKNNYENQQIDRTFISYDYNNLLKNISNKNNDYKIFKIIYKEKNIKLLKLIYSGIIINSKQSQMVNKDIDYCKLFLHMIKQNHYSYFELQSYFVSFYNLLFINNYNVNFSLLASSGISSGNSFNLLQNINCRDKIEEIICQILKIFIKTVDPNTKNDNNETMLMKLCSSINSIRMFKKQIIKLLKISDLQIINNKNQNIIQIIKQSDIEYKNISYPEINELLNIIKQ